MLTPRLEMILANIYTRTIADIGTDHAYIPISLAKEGRIDKAIATDLRPGPLEIAKKNIEKYGFSDIIELRLSDGLDKIEKNEVSTFVIAGMGGDLIKNILDNDKKKAECAECLILQPMNSQDILRKWLFENEFSILKEDISIEQHKVYNLIVAKKGKPYDFQDDFSLHVPDYLCSHKLFDSFKQKKIREFEKIRNGLLNASARDDAMLEKYNSYLKRLERM